MGKGLQISTSDTHWMGKGVYFYDNELQAREFVMKVARILGKGKRLVPAVIRAHVLVKHKNLLNLVNNKTHQQRFRDFVIEQEPTYNNSVVIRGLDMSIEKNRDRCVFRQKCALFDYFCSIYDIHLVISEHRPHPGSMANMILDSIKLNNRAEVQYCVKTVDVIKKIELI